MLGVIVNALTVIVGGLIGMAIGGKLPKKAGDTIMQGMGVATMYIGISGALSGENILITIISIAIGSAIGVLADLDGRFTRGTEKLEKKLIKKERPDGAPTLAEGFIAGSLLFCTGAMTIFGSMQAGLLGDNTTLFAKATIDFVSALVMSTTLGLGVACSSLFILVFQGAIVLLSGSIGGLLTDPCIAEMTCVGSLLLIMIGLNLTGIGKFRVMNFMPAVFLPIILCLFM